MIILLNCFLPIFQLHLLTSLDLLKHEKNNWQHDRLNQVNSIDLLSAELEQYKKFKYGWFIFEILEGFASPSMYPFSLKDYVVPEFCYWASN